MAALGSGARLPMVDHLKAIFPKLADGSFRVTSDRDQAYNCIAWAAGVTHQRWWPLENPQEAYWPEGIQRVATLEAFQAMFAARGFSVCEDEELQPGVEKIALFADTARVPTHAARQLASGRWTSKLGKAEDIEHKLRDLEGEVYGTVVLVMQRAES
jgi:hypothetical protein